MRHGQPHSPKPSPRETHSWPGSLEPGTCKISKGKQQKVIESLVLRPNLWEAKINKAQDGSWGPDSSLVGRDYKIQAGSGSLSVN